MGNQSKLVMDESYTDPKMTALHKDMKQGSILLLAAIVRTGKLYRTMTVPEIKSMYAYLRGDEV